MDKEQIGHIEGKGSVKRGKPHLESVGEQARLILEKNDLSPSGLIKLKEALVQSGIDEKNAEILAKIHIGDIEGAISNGVKDLDVPNVVNQAMEA